MAGSPPKTPLPTLAAGSSSSPNPPPLALATGSSSSPKQPPPTLAAGSSSSPNPPPLTLATGSCSSSPKQPRPAFNNRPTYDELMDSYLRPRVVSRTPAISINEADLYNADPDLLTSNHAAVTSSNGDRAWYFFTPLHPTGSSKTQMKRHVDTGKEGTWVGYGHPQDVRSNGQLIGHRRSFFFGEKMGNKTVKSAWRMMELRLKPNEGGQEAGYSEFLALCKVYNIANAQAEGESSMAAANADAEAPAASAPVTPGREGEPADEEIAAETAAGSVPKKRKTGDKDSAAEEGRQNKADGEIESADAATTKTGEILADGKDHLDPAEKAEQEEPRVRKGDPKFYDFMGVNSDPNFYNFMGVSSAPLDATDEAEQESRDPRDP